MPKALVIILTDESRANPAEIKRSLDEAVKKLDQGKSVSKNWDATVSDEKASWDALKAQIKERQHALKELVQEKKSGTIGPEEFEKKYRKLQDELTELEFKVYNLRLGTHIEP